MINSNGVPNVIYFSDRPDRAAGHLSLEKFVGSWNKGVYNYKAGPPNVDLAIYDKKGDKHAILTFSRPEVKGDTLTFKVRLISGSIPKSLWHSTLFVDPDIVAPMISD